MDERTKQALMNIDVAVAQTNLGRAAHDRLVQDINHLVKVIQDLTKPKEEKPVAPDVAVVPNSVPDKAK